MPITEDDPFGPIKSDKPGDPSPSSREVIQLHKNSDVDSSPNAHHHRLGPARNQASPGDHNHRGGTSKQLGTDITITGLLAPGTVAQVDAVVDSIVAAMVTMFGVTDGRT
jgi:hypothetical protein